MTTLTEYLAGWPRRFDWAASHCGHFAFGWITAATGRDALAVLQVFAQQPRAAGGQGRGDDQRVVQAEAPALLHIECAVVQRCRGQHLHQR